MIQQITAIQTSKESPYIISLLLRIFKQESADGLKERLIKEGFVCFMLKSYMQQDEKCIDRFILYCYNVFGNMGNYRYCRIVVIILEDSEIQKYFLVVVRVISRALSVIPQPIRMNRKRLKNCGRIVVIKCFLTILLNFVQVQVTVVFPLITVKTSLLMISSWFKGIIEFDVSYSYCDENGIENYNNRLFKLDNGDLELRMASSNQGEKQVIEYHGQRIHLTNGDYSPILRKVIFYLHKAMEYVSNDTQKEYLEHYIRSFEDGDLKEHIEGSGLWTKDKKPIVENYIGFIENYRDPYGVRGEWEGFVAIMNKKYTEILSNLVDQAPSLLKLLPWGEPFEKV